MIQQQRQSSLWQQLHLFTHWLTALLEGKGQKNTIAALDGVRAIACLSVVTYHISLITKQDIHIWNAANIDPLIAAIALSGDTGVTLFFILSGFLLFLPYAKALLFQPQHWPSARRFYLRRFLRIIPAYYLSLLLMVLIWRHEYLQPDHLRHWALFLTLFMDSSQATYKSINGPFWTLAVEWQFYLILPLLALGMSLLIRRGSPIRRLGMLVFCLGTLMLWGIGTRYAGIYFNAHPDTTFLLPRPALNLLLSLTYGASGSGTHGKFLEDFAIGMLLSTIYTLTRNLPQESRMRQLPQQLPRLAPWCLFAGLLWLLVMAMWKYNQTTLSNPIQPWPFFNYLAGFYDYVSEFGFALGYGLLVASALFGAGWLKRPLEWAPLRWIGLISYGLYMWHLLLLESFTDHFRTSFQNWGHLLQYSLYWGWLLICVIPFALALFLLIEKPFMNLGNRVPHQESKSDPIKEPPVLIESK